MQAGEFGAEGLQAIDPFRRGELSLDPFAVIPKTSIDEIRVMWSEFKGHRYLDIRVYTEIDGDKVPTKKGVTLRPDLIPELREALEKAAAAAPA